MHLLVPFASALSEAGRHTIRDLFLPNLERLLGRLQPGERHGSDEYSLTPPHEASLAAARGWQGGAGALPFAAHAAHADGIEVLDLAWGQLTPVHWHVGRDEILLTDPESLQLEEAESRALLEAVRELFESEGFALAWGAPLRWYAAHESFADLPTAALDRVVGRNVDRWLPAGREARLLRRLQNEVQMLLYAHPINEAREARGALPVNSFWLSGCGRWQESLAEPIQVDERLRAPLLGEDWAAWAEAWRALDAVPLAALAAAAEHGEPVTLTLAGERFAQRFENAGGSWWARLRRRYSHPSAAEVLEAL
ncbi:MAG: hypothetical protein U1E80_05765 [Piscinibacter sp.]|uniref:hypothetical protein n=1 Tax=Piscinibacter sp. TaxID=1903157 RepID=UPI0011D5C634|nr:MAG: hypothetical protein E6Q93_01905 [Burkholderiaceae bacterium]